MGTPPAVLLLDDGELDDVEALLQEQGIPFARVRGGAIVRGTPPPRDLLIATPRRIEAVAETVGDTLNPPLRVMVVNEDSNALRAQLRRNGFDFLVRRPVHAEALRLLLLHCVYKGEERRREPRVAAGFEVSFRSGLLTRRGTLIDLSVRGCRLQTRQSVDRGKRIKVQIPEALEASDPVTLLGRVARREEEKADGERTFRLGVTFERVDADAQAVLEQVVEELSTGPATLRSGADRLTRPKLDARPAGGEAAAAATKRAAPVEPRGAGASAAEAARGDGATTEAEAPQPGVPDEAPSDERRRAPRAQYAQTVPAFGDRALRVLVGRDLSVGGMRIQQQPEIRIGDRLHLAIYGAPGEEPLLVWGRAERDDAEGGVFVLFDPLDEAVGQRLERLVADLPAVESLHDSEAEAMGTVLSEVVGGSLASADRSA